jgi:hypothetical protein
MKKPLLSLIILMSISICSTQAQITVNSENVVVAGDLVEQAHDTIPNGITIGAGGTNQTWDFSSLSQDELDTLFFLNPSSLPGNTDFPSSNLAMQESRDDSSWIYLTKNASSLSIDGLAQLQQGGAVQAIDLVSTIITFPSTMGTSYASTWNGILLVTPVGFDPDGPGPNETIDSLKITRKSSLSSNIDAWGNVTTPLGTFASLRQIVADETIDTTWTASGGSGEWEIIDPATAAMFNMDQIAYDTTRTARWWSDDANAKFTLVEMDYEANETVNSIDWLKATPAAVTINESIHANANVSLFPNPAKNKTTITTSLTGNNNLKIFDVAGKLIASEPLNTESITISVVDYENGIYFYTINDVNGNVLHANKFVVAK